MSAKSAELVTTSGVRRAFLDFFQQRGHALLPGSPVLPLGDPSVPFVPAGMHQFRHVLLGRAPAPAPQVANSQRCIRVGGRHCDLATVGSDGSHLTFFEMLGSWTFGGSYWKHQACSDALGFLTGPLGINPARLHVTYFQGNAEIPADQECLDAWRSLGVAEERVRPCPASENMWEMGASGPCGPCTEIHVDGVEIWNLVFVQQERSLSGRLTPLETRSIDTGMGLERLSALLAGRSSVYDTDTFQPLLNAVAQFTKSSPYGGTFTDSRDVAYRLLVDHARSVAVALADGIVPDRHYKLRRIIRRCLLIAEREFGVRDLTKATCLLEELALRTIDNLSEAHPTLPSGIPAVKHLLQYEANVFSQLRQKDARGWAEAVAEEPRLAAIAEGGFARNVILGAWRCIQILAQNGFRVLPGGEAYRIYDRYGIGVDTQEDLAKFCGMQGVDAQGFEATRERQKSLSRLERALGKGADVSGFDVLPKDLPATDTTPVYLYSRSDKGDYVFPAVSSEVLAILQKGRVVEQATPHNGPVGVVLTSTNLFTSKGGQFADHGKVVTLNGSVVHVLEPVDVGDVVLHWGELQGGPISVGDEVTVSVDEERRSALMRNHTATHLINGFLREHIAVATQNSAPVSPQQFSLSLDVYGSDLTFEHFNVAEEKARSSVKSSMPVTRKSVTAWNWHSGDPITVIPNAAYPTLDLTVVEIGNVSRELCAGTHVFNTADIGEVCIVRGGTEDGPNVTVVTGEKAVSAIALGERLIEEAKCLSNEAEAIAAVADASNVSQLIDVWRRCKKFVEKPAEDVRMSLFSRFESGNIVVEALHKLEQIAKNVMKAEVAKAASGPFAAVFVQSPCILKTVQLMKATRPLPDKALLLLTLLRDGSVRGRCCVPAHFVGEEFNAERWIAPVAKALKAKAVAPPGFNPTNVCILEKVKSKPSPEFIQLLIDDARRFAQDAFPQRVASV